VLQTEIIKYGNKLLKNWKILIKKEQKQTILQDIISGEFSNFPEINSL